VRTLLLLVCILLGTVPGQSQDPRYFPSGAFDLSSQNFMEKWYSGTLRALEEPSLFALRNDPSRRVYRFLWLPSFHRPISVRLTINADSSGLIVTRSVDSHAGLLTKPASDTGELIRDSTISIDKVQTQDVLERLQRAAFWSMPIEEGRQLPHSSGTSSGGTTVPVPGIDGSRWILEGVDGGEYHVVDRWSPPDNSYSKLCKYLSRLGRVEATLY
jgi:hypothetical protein